MTTMGAAVCALLLMLLATVHAASATVYKVTDAVPNTPGGQRFSREVGVTNMQQALQNAANFIRGTAFSLSTPKNIATVTLTVENFNGVADTSGSNIRLSATYVQNYEPGNSKAVRTEITGVVYHESTHVWQNMQNGDYNHNPYFRGIVEGIADWVRLRAGFAAAHWTRERGGNWWEGYQRTAFFLDWIQTTKKANFVNLLNEKMGKAQWSNDFFRQIVGTGVNELWQEYQDRAFN